MQGQAQAKAVQGALASRSSEASQDYAKKLPGGTATAMSCTPTASTVTVGDFTGTITNSGGTITLTVTAGPTWFAASTATKTKSFKLYLTLFQVALRVRGFLPFPEGDNKMTDKENPVPAWVMECRKFSLIIVLVFVNPPAITLIKR